MKYGHIIWDWNGTLLNDAWLCVDVMNGVLARRGMSPLTLERYQEVFGFPVIEYYRRLGFDFDAEPFEVSGTEFIVEYEKRRHEAGLRPGARETLQAIHELGIPQSLLSAYEQGTLDELTESLGVKNFFRAIVGLDNHYAHSKVEAAWRLLGKIGQDSPRRPSRGNGLLLVGDTEHDQEVGTAIGAECVLVPGEHQSVARLQRLGVPVLDSVNEVVSLVK
ncbi:MAG: HAD family hydrolase [Fidelibacterota bacterium]